MKDHVMSPHPSVTTTFAQCSRHLTAWPSLTKIVALAIALLALMAQGVRAQEAMGYAEEKRTVIGFRLDHEVVGSLLPDGWQVDAQRGGPHEGANFFLVLADQRLVRDARGRTVESGAAVVWSAPARAEDERPGFIVLGGYVEPQFAPGTYKVYKPANLELSRSEGEGGLIKELWTVQAENDSVLRAELRYAPTPAQSAHVETYTYSANDTAIRRLYHYEEEEAILSSEALGVDRISELELQIGNGELKTIIADAQPLSVVSLPWAEIKEFIPEP